MKPIPAILAKTVLLAIAGIGLSACVAAAPEPVAYYPRPAYYYSGPGYYYQPYYAPRPAYNSFYFSYSERDSGRGRHHRRWHR